MAKGARLNPEEAEKIANNIEDQGGDASELRQAMARTTPSSSFPRRTDGLTSGDAPPKTPVAAFWEIFHSLPSPTPLSAEGQTLKGKILEFAREHGLRISQTRDLDRFAEALTRSPRCPWGKDPCICYNVQAGGPCRAGLLVK